MSQITKYPTLRFVTKITLKTRAQQDDVGLVCLPYCEQWWQRNAVARRGSLLLSLLLNTQRIKFTYRRWYYGQSSSF